MARTKALNESHAESSIANTYKKPGVSAALRCQSIVSFELGGTTSGYAGGSNVCRWATDTRWDPHDTFYDVAHRPDAAEVSACASFRLFSRGAEGEGRSRARQCVSVMVLTNGIADDLEDSTDGCTPADGSQRRAWSLHRSWHHDNPMNNDV